MAHYYRIGSDAVDSTPRAKRIRSRGNLEIAKSCAASGFTSVVTILFERDENFIYLLSVLSKELKIDFISSREIGFWRIVFLLKLYKDIGTNIILQ